MCVSPPHSVPASVMKSLPQPVIIGAAPTSTTSGDMMADDPPPSRSPLFEKALSTRPHWPHTVGPQLINPTAGNPMEQGLPPLSSLAVATSGDMMSDDPAPLVSPLFEKALSTRSHWPHTVGPQLINPTAGNPMEQGLPPPSGASERVVYYLSAEEEADL